MAIEAAMTASAAEPPACSHSSSSPAQSSVPLRAEDTADVVAVAEAGVPAGGS